MQKGAVPLLFIVGPSARLHQAFLSCFCVEQYYPLKLSYGHIARISTSALHVPLFCVDQDYPLKLPYGHITRKSNSPLYELMFCVEQDYPLQLP